MKEQGHVFLDDQNQSVPMTISGTSISPGLAEGIIHLQHDLLAPADSLQAHVKHSVEEECSRLDSATVKTIEDLLDLATHVEHEIDKNLAEVFGAHKEILNDQVLKEELRKEIIDNLVTASSAVKSVFLRWENRFLLMESQTAREKVDDFRDISRRLLNTLAGIFTHPLEDLPKKCVLVTRRLLPSDTIFLNTRSTAAVLLEHGTPGCHAALFTRQIGVPCISGIPNIMSILPEGKLAQVNACSGVIQINPNKKDQSLFKQQLDDNTKALRKAQLNSQQVAKTQDGITITVNANVGSLEESLNAVQQGADGVGLYRIDQFYIGRTYPPSCDELTTELRRVLDPLKGQKVCIRLLDVGADKPLPFIAFMAETNPSLGRRGIRLLLKYPDLLRTQINAILNLVDDFDVHILVPMVTLATDMQFVKNTLNTLCLQRKLIPPKLGAMIETPAAALSSSSIAPLVDFMSFGTNDLTQYAFAADRENASVEGYYDDGSEVIFRMIRLVHQDAPDIPLSICGELAGRKIFVEKLIKSGIRSLSVASPLIPIIKEAVRQSRAC